MDANLRTRLAGLRLMVFDVDGVLTDGKLYLGPDGQEWRSSHVRDGLGLKLLHQAGITTAVISGRPGGGLSGRLARLGVSRLHFGSDDKLPLFDSLLAELSLRPEQAGMVGDDTPDLPLIHACGAGFCPADAHPEVRAAVDWIAPSNGGHGAVREVTDLILQARA